MARETMIVAGVMQVLLLSLLTVVAGLGPVGWLAALACGAIGYAALSVGLRRTGVRAFGPADLVTLARAVLVGGVTALVADTVVRPAPIGLLVALASVALVMDAIDGHVARRTGTASPLGARLDMEVDAFLILVLSVYVASSVGAWVLVIGGMRYAFVLASTGRTLSWLKAPLPPSMSRKTVAAAQGIVLAVAASGVLPNLMAIALTGLALAALAWSFGQDVRYLAAAARRAVRAVPTPVRAGQFTHGGASIAGRAFTGAAESA